jgi:hypothetical protein
MFHVTSFEVMVISSNMTHPLPTLRSSAPPRPIALRDDARG